MNEPNDTYRKWMIVLFCFILSYFLGYLIPHILIALSK